MYLFAENFCWILSVEKIKIKENDFPRGTRSDLLNDYGRTVEQQFTDEPFDRDETRRRSSQRLPPLFDVFHRRRILSVGISSDRSETFGLCETVRPRSRSADQFERARADRSAAQRRTASRTWNEHRENGSRDEPPVNFSFDRRAFLFSFGTINWR